MAQLWKQRYRWGYGTIEAIWKHRHALIDRGPAGPFGRRGLPLLALFGVVLPVLAPVVDILLVYGLLFLNRIETAAFWLAMLALQTLASILTFRLDREPRRPLWAVA